jgi:hypothetical protein
MIGLYVAGESILDLAQKFQIHRSTVLARVKRKGVPRRTGVVARQLPEAQRLYENDWSLARVGEHLGIDGETVRQAFLRADVELRPRPGWRR